MGHDVTFHLVDVEAVTERLLPALAEDGPPPPSPFDALPTAKAEWDAARAALRANAGRATLREVSSLIVRWSSESLPYVFCRNLALTYEPLRMEPELLPAPSAGLGPLSRLVRGIGLARARRADDDHATADFAERPDAAAIRRWYLEHARFRGRIARVLSLFRAAERHGLAVLEMTDVARSPGRDGPELHWPGLRRFGLEGDPLDAGEWSSVLDAAARYGDGDREDLLDRIAEVQDEALLAKLIRAFDATPDEVKARRALLEIERVETRESALTERHVFVPGRGVCEVLGRTSMPLPSGGTAELVELRAGDLKFALPVRSGAYRPILDAAKAAALLAGFRPDAGALGAERWNRRHRAIEEMLRRASPEDHAEVLAHFLARTEPLTSFAERKQLMVSLTDLASELAAALGRDVEAVRRELAPDLAL